MEETKNAATEANAEMIATQENVAEDSEAKIATLEAEKARLIEESANYKVAFFKEKSKNAEDETDEEKMERIAKKALADSRLAEINREQDVIIKKALKENKELKLANLNKPDVAASTSSHSEGQQVRDTLITPEQLSAFKARGWSDKDIERYKKNLQRYGTR